MLLGYRTGNNKPVLQIERKYYMNRLCQYTELSSNSPIKSWVKKLWMKDHTKLQFDPTRIYNSSDAIVYDDDIDERVFSFHSRLHINGRDLCSKDICKECNYDDSWVEINGKFYCISLILCDRNHSVYIIGQKAITRKLYDNLYSFDLSKHKRVVRINNTAQQCLIMEIENENKKQQFISRCKTRTQVD